MATNQPVDLGIRGISDAVEIGRGGFAIVYRALQPAFERFVAVKVLEVTDVDDSAQVAFQRECRAIGRVSGRANILTVHDAGLTAAGKPYLVMALARESLDDVLERRGTLPVSEAVGVGVKISWALESAHEAGILHRDVKPGNILVADDGEPQLADFGIARVASATRHSRSGMAFTPAHAPPEALAGLAPTAAGDVYSLASTLFNLIAGHPPFVEHPDESLFVILARVGSAPVPDLRPRGVPDSLCRVIERAMAKEPAERPRSAAAFAADLDAVVPPPPPPAPPPAPPQISEPAPPSPQSLATTPSPPPPPKARGPRSSWLRGARLAWLVSLAVALIVAVVALRTGGGGDSPAVIPRAPGSPISANRGPDVPNPNGLEVTRAGSNIDLTWRSFPAVPGWTVDVYRDGAQIMINTVGKGANSFRLEQVERADYCFDLWAHGSSAADLRLAGSRCLQVP